MITASVCACCCSGRWRLMPTTAGGRFRRKPTDRPSGLTPRGGDPAVNRYLAWVSEEVKRYYAIDLRIVPVADAADAVKRIQTEAQAGRRRGRVSGSAVDQRRKLSHA
ncbi:hypothetical protein IE988_14560 [Klebsiella pneumoniae]|uniref:Uncharacterized protein n=1 Tax=Klebsiella pneumoniae TaxID=573 RepID=A0A927DUV4_KLEPN|nr:hypothetical protein [Klebsiella pneumoniae]